jgi:phosphatidate cytidylyltransferase
VTRFLSGAVLFLIAVGVVWFAPAAVFRAAAFTLLILCVVELVHLAHASGLGVSMWLTVTGSLVTLAAFVLAPSSGGGLATTLAVVLMAQAVAIPATTLAGWSPDSRNALAVASTSLFPSLYVALPLGALTALRESEGPPALFLLMLTIIVSDTAQYYTGRLVGRTPLAPVVSPKKTIEGALGGLVFGAVVFAGAGAWWLERLPVLVRVLLGSAIVAAGIAGDLFESLLKRNAGVKDSSALIPGHGGMLDRLDALLFAAPVYYVVLQYV